MAGTRIASISGLRGVVGDGLDPVAATEFAAAYVSGRGKGAIVVGNDGRTSAPVFEHAVVSAVAGTGRDVWVAGSVATPTLGKLVRDLKALGGIQISASHNPTEYNGLKFFQPGGMVLGPAEGSRMLERWHARDFDWAAWDELGTIHPIGDPNSAHLDALLGIVDVKAIRDRAFPVVLDACHGSGGRLGSLLLRKLGCRLLVLGENPDGRYDHPPEPTEENLNTFASIVSATRAAVGFAQDPDADRLAIVDETGHYIGEELTLALATVRRLETDSGRAPLVLNLSTSKVTEDLARQAGREVFRTPVGEIHVVEKMLEEKALLGGEGNGGVIDPRVGFVRDSFVAMALVLDLMASRGKRLSVLVSELPTYAMVKRRFALVGPISAFAQRLPAVAAAFPDALLDRRDGLHLEWPDRWVQVRASNTEPIARVIAEAADFATANSLAERVGALIATHDLKEENR